jgi:hypothetical protein
MVVITKIQNICFLEEFRPFLEESSLFPKEVALFPKEQSCPWGEGFKLPRATT